MYRLCLIVKHLVINNHWFFNDTTSLFRGVGILGSVEPVFSYVWSWKRTTLPEMQINETRVPPRRYDCQMWGKSQVYSFLYHSCVWFVFFRVMIEGDTLPEAILMSTNYNPLDWKLKIPVCRQKLICILSVVVIFQRYMITKSFLFIREYIFSYIIPLINGVGFIEKGFNQILNNLTMFNNVSQKYQMSFFNCRESSQTYQ